MVQLLYCLCVSTEWDGKYDCGTPLMPAVACTDIDILSEINRVNILHWNLFKAMDDAG